MHNQTLRTTRIKAIQAILGVAQDGDFGPRSRAALEGLLSAERSLATEGMASSFADPADIEAFKRCKQRGLSDMACFKEGDNGIGLWGDDTTVDRPMCALPREDWAHLIRPEGTLVDVVINNKVVQCELRDTMPAKRHIRNGAVIDLNPAAIRAFGLRPPVMIPCRWSWAD